MSPEEAFEEWWNSMPSTEIDSLFPDISARDKDQSKRIWLEATRQAYEDAARICMNLSRQPSSLWEEAGCWKHAMELCSQVIRAKAKEYDKD